VSVTGSGLPILLSFPLFQMLINSKVMLDEDEGAEAG
jgi:hypothetical protein